MPLSTPTSAATATIQPPPSPTPLLPDTGWEELQIGLQRRIINLLDEQGTHLEQLYLLRINPQYFTFNIAYDPEAKTLEDWQHETNALIVLNGGFFRFENSSFIPNGLTIIDGLPIGIGYGPFGGMFVVTKDGPELRWLSQTPYDPNEMIYAALQSFPVLVKPGGILGFPEEHEDNLQARRTVLGQTKTGEFLFLVASIGYFTLHQLSSYLIQSDLNLDIALNLDGGPSTGLFLSMPREYVLSYVPVPVVITVSNP